MTDKQTVLDFFCAEDEAQAERNLYKNTTCGAWIEFNDTGILIGSIVEGLDFGTMSYPLHYANGFTGADIQARINAVEAEADAFWDWANRPCDKKGRWRKNGSTTQADLDIDPPDIHNDYRMFEQGMRSC